MLYKNVSVESKYDITKSSAPVQFEDEANEVFSKYLDIKNPTTAAQKEIIDATLTRAKKQLAKDELKYGKTFGKITRVLLTDVMIVGFCLPGFDLEPFYKYLELIEAGKNATFVCFQRIFDITRRISKKYLGQLWKIEQSGFDFNKLKPIVVWYDKKRKKFMILDGGHTIIMCLLHGMSYAKYVTFVFADSLEEAVAVYCDQYKCSTNLSPLELLAGDCVRGNKGALAIFSTIRKLKINIDGFVEDGDVATVKCFSLLRNIYDDYGQQGLNFVFEMPKAVWGIHDKKITDKSLIMVLGQVFEACSQNKESFDSIYNAMASCQSAQEFMDDARKFILDGNYKSIGGKTNEGPITTYCKYKAGMIKLQKKD